MKKRLYWININVIICRYCVPFEIKPTDENVCIHGVFLFAKRESQMQIPERTPTLNQQIAARQLLKHLKFM